MCIFFIRCHFYGTCLEENLARTFPLWSSTKLVRFCLKIGIKTWQEGVIMCSYWLKLNIVFSTEPFKNNLIIIFCKKIVEWQKSFPSVLEDLSGHSNPTKFYIRPYVNIHFNIILSVIHSPTKLNMTEISAWFSTKSQFLADWNINWRSEPIQLSDCAKICLPLRNYVAY